ncbi:MAG: amidohydrolase family protein [Bacillota bacterium]|nr:amidohydrolase family protein [Bacillota bacterium]
MIIDAHVHLGHDTVFDEDSTEEELLQWHDRCAVFGAIIQPFIPRPYIEDTRAIHDRIAAFCHSKPGHYFGMASISPHLRPAEYDEEARRCIMELDFIALKMTPIAHAVRPSSADGLHVFEVAAALGVPVMVHTGAGIPFADPAGLESVAADFTQVPIILAHAGGDLFFTQALSLARRFSHVYLEPSWLSILNVQRALKTIGAGKIMFSSDHAINIPVELAKYTTLLAPGPELDLVLAGTAIDVFGLRSRLALS